MFFKFKYYIIIYYFLIDFTPKVIDAVITTVSPL